MAAGGRTTDHAPETIYRALTVVELDTRPNELASHLATDAVWLALSQACCVRFLLGARGASALAVDLDERGHALLRARNFLTVNRELKIVFAATVRGRSSTRARIIGPVSFDGTANTPALSHRTVTSNESGTNVRRTTVLKSGASVGTNVLKALLLSTDRQSCEAKEKSRKNTSKCGHGQKMISPARTSARSTQKPIAAPKKKGAHPLRDAPLKKRVLYRTR